MTKCPNCGRSTMRTKDWACKWCGYPLISGSYPVTPETFAELRGRKEQELASVTPEIKPEPNAKPASEPNQDTELEAGVKSEPEPEQQIEPGASKEEPEPEETVEQSELKADVDEVPEVVPQSGTEAVLEGKPKPAPVVAPVAEVTVAELCESYQSYGMEAHKEFKNRVFRVNGIVDTVLIKDISSQYSVVLTGVEKHELGAVHCKFEKKDVPELERLEAGQTLTVQGRYDGFVTDILLADCVFVD